MLTPKASILLPLSLSVVVAACTGNTNPGAGQIAPRTATLRANVSCARGEMCDGYFRWRVHGSTSWTNGPDLGPAPGPFNSVAGYSGKFTPATTYDYQYCGRGSRSNGYRCVGPTATQPPGTAYDPGVATSWSTFTTLRDYPTITAKQFSDSIGVNDHITYGDEPLYNNQVQAVANMKALGITHVRFEIYDWTNTGGEAYFLSRFKTVQQAGFKIDAIVPQNCTDRYPAWDTRNPPDCISALQRNAGLAGVEGFEDPNEADNNGDPNWASELRSYDAAVYLSAKIAGHYPVYGPSLVYGNSFRALGNQSTSFDFENFHDYTAATSPNPDAVASQFVEQAPFAALKPAVSTETGYHNAVGCHDGCQAGIDRSGAAIYTLRTYLEHLADGVDRTFTYELYDEPNLGCGTPPCQEAQFGLIDASGTWKPAAHALANLTTLIGSGSPATTTPLAWGVDAGDQIADLRYLDIKRADGSHDLALWRTCMGADKLTCPASVWNPLPEKDLTVSPIAIHVNGTFKAWQWADPIFSSSWFTSSGPILVLVGADPVLLHITPS